MAERPPPSRGEPTEAELEGALRDLRGRLDYPPTPDLARAVRRRLEAQPARRPFWAGLFPAPRRLAPALLAVVLIACAALALSPGARGAIGERLGLPGIAIVYTTPTPPATAAAPATTVPSPTAPLATGTASPTATRGTPGATASRAAGATPTATGPLGGDHRFGVLVTLEEARRRLDFPVLTPGLPELGTPDEVYYSPSPPGGQVALVYGARPGLPPAVGTGLGLYLTQFRGAINRDFYMKGIGPGTTLEEVTVNGARGYWIAGEPHSFFYRDERGAIQSERSRSVDNTLIWERGGVTYRLEANIAKDQALRIAASLR